MRYLVVDDEPFALENLKEALKPVCTELDQVVSFSSPFEALTSVAASKFDAAFLDIEMFGMDGITFAKKIKDIQPDIHIIFVTAYEKYAVSAFQIHATGYLLKPVMPADIQRELTFIYKDTALQEKHRIRIQTFGNFAVFINGTPLQFNRAKTKELLALLVDREGSSLTTKEACAILWEDIPYSSSQKNYFHQILHDLRSTLKTACADTILIKKRNSIAIDPSKFECDSYRFMEGDPIAVNSYRHNYMSSYSWAEFTTAALENRK